MKNLLFIAFFCAQYASLFSQQFAPLKTNPFNISIGPDAYSLYLFQDLNKDSIFDILVQEDFPYIMFGGGAIGAPDFSGAGLLTYLDEDLNGQGSGSFLNVNSLFLDLDKDGDLDHLYNYYSDDPALPATFAYENNFSEVSVPYTFYFGPENPGSDYGFPELPLNTYEFTTQGDLDQDGDVDILGWRVYELSGVTNYVLYKNIGGSGPFEINGSQLENPFGLSASNVLEGKQGIPVLADWDHDNDLDLLALEPGGDWYYYQNNATGGAAQFAAPVQNPFGLEPLPTEVAAVLAIDVNNDGYKDLLCGAGQEVYYYQFDPLSASHEPAGNNTISVFPNPGLETMHWAADGQTIKKVTLTTIDGKTTQVVFPEKEDRFVAVNNLAAGIYFVSFENTEGAVQMIKWAKAPAGQ